MNRALFIIDVQVGLFHPQPPPFQAELVLERINALAARARSQGVPVFFIQHGNPVDELEVNTPGWQLDDRLVTGPSDYRVQKTSCDSFHRTDLEERLRLAGVTEVVVCGYASEFCVDNTVRRAVALGFAVKLVSDAHTTHDKPHLTAEQIIRHENATLPHLNNFGPLVSAVSADGLWV
jgi:nicotinamidase-related amidase